MIEPKNYRKLNQQERRFLRLEYVKDQKGKCHFCGNHLDLNPSAEVLSKKVKESLFPEGFFKNPIHLHHCHDTGMTIGAVHAHCNAVLWQYHGE